MKTKIFQEKSQPKPNYLLDFKLMLKNVLYRKFPYNFFERKTLNTILKIQQKLLLFTSAKKQKKLSWFTG